MKSSRTKAAKECYLCGSKDRLTRDHLPPKNLFPKPLPSNLVTAPCCASCNNSRSQEDEYFRVAASSLLNVNSQGKHIWKERVVTSTLNSNRIKTLLDDLRRNIQPTTLVTQAGRMQASIIPVQADVIKSFIIRLTKGLLSIHYPQVDRNALDFEITQIDQFKLDSIIVSGVADAFTHYEVGEGVYRHWRGVAFEDNHNGIWVHMFYDAATWMIKHERRVPLKPPQS